MPRIIRNTAILAKIETTIGTDAVPTGANDAVLVSEISITPLEATNIDRNLIRPYLGGSEQLVGSSYVRCTLNVELAGSGTAGTAPRWGQLLQACGVGEGLLTAPSRVEYTPISTGFKTLTVYWYDDGVLHKLLGAMGNAQVMARAGERPMLQIDLTGLYGGVTAAANPSVTLTAWRVPPVVTKDFVTDITIGGTYATGAVTGGTVYPSTGLELDFGNQVQFTPLAGSERIDLVDRAMTGRFALDLTAAQEVALMTSVRANTTQSVAMRVGTAAGNSTILFAPTVQLLNPRKEELNGTRMVGFDLRLVPTSGNDELRLVCL